MSTPALLTAVDCTSHTHLIIGSNPLASARCTRSLEVGARVIVIAPPPTTRTSIQEDPTKHVNGYTPDPLQQQPTEIHYSLQKRIEGGEVEWIQRGLRDEDLLTLGRQEVDGVVDAVFITGGTGGRAGVLSTHISTLCRRHRIPLNVADSPALSTFTLLSTHSDGPLQIGVTTSGKGCKLASRIRREVSAALPSGLGAAIEKLGAMRRRIWEEDYAAELAMDPAGQIHNHAVDEDDDTTGQMATFNKLVTAEDAEAARGRRMRWLAQICEYWPMQRLALITDADVEQVLQSYAAARTTLGDMPILDSRKRRARIILAGSGPGNPDFLTTATHKAILSADLILADKLVPAAVMDLIPRRTPVHIARKFPGNADKAQEELLQLGLQGLLAGKIVVRLKQGDPYIYGRGAEEYEFFRGHGYTPIVLPGVTSALSAPLFAGIPATHRNVADEVLICTGTGRKGAAPDPPSYVETRTVVFLMSLHRLAALVESLMVGDKHWPKETPCAVIERASCPDQRVIRASLEHVCAAVEEEGSRPPGLLVVGKSCEVLWHGKQKWVVEDGFRGLQDLQVPEEAAVLSQLGQEAVSVS